MAELSDFTQSVLEMVPGVPEFLIRRAVLKACIEFCQKSDAVQAVHQLLLADAVYPITLPPGENQMVTRVLEAGVDGALLLRGQDYDQSATEFDQFDFIDSPPSGSELSITYGVRPTRTATTVPDLLLDEYEEGIAAGAAMRLVRQPGQPWSDARRVSYFNTLFVDSFRDAKRKALDRAARLYQGRQPQLFW